MSESNVLNSKALVLHDAVQRYRGVATVMMEADHGFILHLKNVVWYPLDEERPIDIGFAQASDFHLHIPRREMVTHEGVRRPWFINQDFCEPIFEEATAKIAELCNARPSCHLETAVAGTPMIGVLPGFFYETEKAMGFHVNPESLYSSHLLFFSTGYCYTRALLEMAELATESSVRFKVFMDKGEIITVAILHTHLLVPALSYENPVAMLKDLFVRPFEAEYTGAMKLRTARTDDMFRSEAAAIPPTRRQNLEDAIKLFNEMAIGFWNTYAEPNICSGLREDFRSAPSFSLRDNVLLYYNGRKNVQLAPTIANLKFIERMTGFARMAMTRGFTPKEREATFRRMFSVADRFEEYGGIKSAATLPPNTEPDLTGKLTQPTDG